MNEPTHDGPTITPPPALTPRHDPVAEARAILAAAEAAAASAKAEREKVEKLMAERAAPAAPAAKEQDPAIAEMRHRLEYIRKDELVNAVKRMGFRHDDWTPERILRFAPDADPRTEAGKLALDKFRADNLDLFVEPGRERRPMIQEMVEAATKRAQGTPDHPVFGDAYVAKVFAHNFTEKATR